MPDSTAGLLKRPDESYVPKQFVLARLRKRAKLVRIFDHTAGHGSTSFNPNLAPLNKPRKGGRFDGTSDDAFGVYYVASPDDATAVAVWETLSNDIEYVKSRDRQLIFKRTLAKRSFVFLEAAHQLNLIDVRTAAGATHFRANIKALQGDNRVVTRLWASYMRRSFPQTHGLIYTSSGVGGGTKGDAVVLFGDTAVTDAPVDEVPPIVPLNGREGLRLVSQALRGSNVRVGGW